MKNKKKNKTRIIATIITIIVLSLLIYFYNTYNNIEIARVKL